ncbi:hypothetical protein AA0498_1494 [Acidomonas methanolica]|uniref:Multidrug resistance efflux pump MdtC n=1 Tax=Acidomonas methanolica NBRC 104435 TaxID=1231351 RepID=A0A023D8M8_ACIMT|nr:multidrug resistance efflux pump MdtC [Acidomonas methanolica NBRC 104435]GBQ51525.1 hypothetical protein AA0498_1494 [Acidomonas methanolica]GEL00441.1 hypothetical protein AME01nite_29390 [Acidomonas methanolica NBRC 104435]
MTFIAFFVRRPVATTLLLVAAVLSGLLALPSLPVSDLPDVSVPVISVSASNAGGTPETMARTVAAPLERHLGAIAGVTQMQSVSTRGETMISLGFEVGRDLNGAARDVEAAIRAARADLPKTPGFDPRYHRANPNATPVLILAVTPGMMAMPRLYDLVNVTLRPMLLQVPGVGDVKLLGSSAPAVRVAMNPLAFFKYSMGFENLRAALASANAHTPKGVIDTHGQRFQLLVNDQAERAADYRNLIIAYKNNRPIRLNDVATVSDSMQDVNAAAFFDGKPALTLMVRAQPGANLVGSRCGDSAPATPAHADAAGGGHRHRPGRLRRDPLLPAPYDRHPAARLCAGAGRGLGVPALRHRGAGGGNRRAMLPDRQSRPDAPGRVRAGQSLADGPDRGDGAGGG